MPQVTDESFDRVRKFVTKKCEQMGVNGIFAMTQTDTPKIYWGAIGRDDGLNNASGGPNYNLHAIALAKLSFVLMHHAPSGKVLYEGEVPYRGGILSSEGMFGFAFSGATEDQDVEIATSASEFHGSLRAANDF